MGPANLCPWLWGNKGVWASDLWGLVRISRGGDEKKGQEEYCSLGAPSVGKSSKLGSQSPTQTSNWTDKFS